MLKSRRIAKFERSLREAGLPVGVRLWNGTTIAATQAPGVWITVKTPGVLGLLANPSMGKLARGYVEQQLDVEGGAREAVRVAEALSGAQDHGPRDRRRLHPWISHTRFFDRKAVNRHYDVSDEFFGLWLDRQRVYSCAYFRRADDTLELAQEQKLDHICRKLRLAPGERFLDIGCGWGALVLRAASRFGVRALGVTLSRNQHSYAQAEIRERGLEDRCEVRLLDYRDIPADGGFDNCFRTQPDGREVRHQAQRGWFHF